MNTLRKAPRRRYVTRHFGKAVANKVLKGLLDTLCDIDNREYLEVLSKTEPLIVAVNHINFLEVPILVTHSYPLRLTGLVKSETWNNPLFAFLLNTYGAILTARGPIRKRSGRCGKP